jgi:hypothetical protein
MRRALFAGGSFNPTTFVASRANMTDVSRISTAGGVNPTFNGNSRFVARTSSVSMAITWFDNTQASSSAINQLSVYSTLAGVRSLVGIVPPTPTGAVATYTGTLVLPAGNKLIEIVNGPTFESTPFGQGSWLATQMASVTFQDTATNIPDPNVNGTPRMLVQGTSIECGLDANPISQFGAGELMRNGLSGVDQYPGAVVVDAYGGGEVYHDWFQASGVNSVATMLTQMASLGNVTDWIIPLATNDWAQSQWTAAQMASALIAGWPTVKAAFPNAKLWLVGCPHRESEATPNSLGQTLQNYRDAGPTIVAGLPAGQAAYFNVEPSIPFTLAYYNADLVHLTNLGQATYAQLIMAGIGR